MEKPIIASNIGGSLETIKHEKTGFLFSAGDINALYRNMSEIFDLYPATLEVMGTEGRKNVIKKLKCKNAIKKIVEVDKKILSAGQHHGSTYYQHLEFIKAINNNLKPQVSINDGLHAVAIGEAAEKSIKENRVVKMSEFNL